MQIRRNCILPLLLALFVFLIQGCGDEDQIIKREPAPGFTLKLFDGGNFNMSDHKGRPVIVNFFASWCIPCKTEAPILEKVYQEYYVKQEKPEEKVVFVGIAIQDTDSAARAFVKETGLTFPTGLDGEGTIKQAFGVYGLPTTFFVGRDGLINYTHAGSITEELLVNEMQKLY